MKERKDTGNNHDTTHGTCGKTWKQRGNKTGHCAGCHETLEYPKGWPLKLVNGSWRSTKPHPRALTQ